MNLNLKFRPPVAFVSLVYEKTYMFSLNSIFKLKMAAALFPENNPATQSKWENSWPSLGILSENMAASVYPSHSIAPSNEKSNGSRNIKFRKI